MANNAKPDHYLYIVIPGPKPEDKKNWVRFGACWTAKKGFSIKIDPAFTMFPPFNDRSLGVAMMPVDDDTDNASNSNTRTQNTRQDTRR